MSRPSAPLHDRFTGGNFTRRAAREPPRNLRNLNLGFSLQATRFLVRLLQASPVEVICLEVFDDIGVERADGSKIAEQNKTNRSHNPLSDRAVDPWKTFGIWNDARLCGDLDPHNTSFVI